MNFTSRIFLAILATFSLYGCSSTPEYKIAKKGDISVQVTVVDEADHPIMAAEVWRTATPLPWSKWDLNRGGTAPSSEYIARISARYGGIAEFAHVPRPGFTDPIPTQTPGFLALDPTDSNGHTDEVIKYELGRTGQTDIGLSAMSYCYESAIVQKQVPENTQDLKVRIVLKRDPSCALPTAPYWKKYQEARWKFSGKNWKEGMAEPVREELMANAKSAEDAGDKKAAARIYSWIPYLPTATYFSRTSGSIKASGYTREDEQSARNIELLEKAHQLDPENRYIQMKLLLIRPPVDRKNRIQALEKLIADGPDGLWPHMYIMLENSYYANGQNDKARQLFLSLKSIEPEYIHNQNDLEMVRRARYTTIQDFQRDYVTGNDPNKNDKYYKSAFYYAIRSGRVDLTEWLSTKSAQLPDFAPYQAVCSRRPEMVAYVLQRFTRKMSNAELSTYIKQIDDALEQRFDDTEDLQKIRKMLEDSIKHE